ncbi:MAG: glycosyltransferase [bacterium]|nr:glycosyltransferase [bacterium]
MKLSIIIPALNEQHYIGKLLECLTDQDFRNFEVIVSDSNSDDNTIAVAERFLKKLNLKIVQSAKRGVSLARNRGALEARSKWLLFLDADTQIPGNFLTNILAETEKKNHTIASVKFRANSPKLIDKFGSKISFLAMKALEKSNHPNVSGFCILIRRELHQKIGGFNTKLNLGEDVDYAARAIRTGAKFGFLHSTYLLISVRRYESEGRIKTFLKTLYFESYRRLNRFEINDGVIAYEFGKHEKDVNRKS